MRPRSPATLGRSEAAEGLPRTPWGGSPWHPPDLPRWEGCSRVLRVKPPAQAHHNLPNGSIGGPFMTLFRSG